MTTHRHIRVRTNTILLTERIDFQKGNQHATFQTPKYVKVQKKGEESHLHQGHHYLVDEIETSCRAIISKNF